MPKRIQRKRTKGWRLPPDTVCVTRPGKWGNPYSVVNGNREQALALAKDYFRTGVANGIFPIEELRGKDLACWCSLDLPCHADVLLELANQ